LSQSNPLKAVAEFVENSIDANVRHVTITRGREKGETYLRIRDDGDGIPVDEEGKPNFRLRRDAHLRFQRSTSVRRVAQASP
jgi:signal transduction histidine kinase